MEYGKVHFDFRMDSLDKKILVENIQSVLEVTATETFLSLEEGFTRALPLN